MVKPNVTAKRVGEIDKIQSELRKLAEEYKHDFTEPNALDSAIDKDLHAADHSLELLKGLYKSKTDKEC